MNQKQKQYLVKRIDEVLKQHIVSINSDQKEFKDPTIAECFLDGSLKLKPLAEIIKAIGEYDYDKSCISGKELLDGVDKIDRKINAAKDAVVKKQQERLSKVQAYATALKDSVVFGSDKFALDTIDEFSKMKF